MAIGAALIFRYVAFPSSHQWLICESPVVQGWSHIYQDAILHYQLDDTRTGLRSNKIVSQQLRDGYVVMTTGSTMENVPEGAELEVLEERGHLQGAARLCESQPIDNLEAHSCE